MRFAFVLPYPVLDPWVAAVAAATAFRGHPARVFLPRFERDIDEALRRYAPAALAFAPTGGTLSWAAAEAARLRPVLGGLPTIAVGELASDHPDDVVAAGFDFALVGEPDETIPELLWRIEREKTLEGTMGTVSRRGPAPTREPLVDLDETQAADFEIWKRYRFVQAQKTLPFALTRGLGDDLHRDARPHREAVARRFEPLPRLSQQEAIVRLQMAKQRRPRSRRFSFTDDALLLDRDFLFPFLDRYAREVSRPFSCAARADLLDQPVIDALVGAGCDSVRLWIGAFDEGTRSRLARVDLPDDALLAAAERMRSRALRFDAIAQVGWEGETAEHASRGADLLAQMRPAFSFVHALWGSDPSFGRAAAALPLAGLAPHLRKVASGLAQHGGSFANAALHRLLHDGTRLRAGELGMLSTMSAAARRVGR